MVVDGKKMTWLSLLIKVRPFRTKQGNFPNHGENTCKAEAFKSQRAVHQEEGQKIKGTMPLEECVTTKRYGKGDHAARRVGKNQLERLPKLTEGKNETRRKRWKL